MSFRVDKQRPDLQEGFYIFEDILDFGLIAICFYNGLRLDLEAASVLFCMVCQKDTQAVEQFLRLDGVFLYFYFGLKAFDGLDVATFQLYLNRDGFKYGRFKVFFYLQPL